MIRSIMFLVLITAVAGFLTISCKQDSGKDTEIDSEKTATTETGGDKDKGSEAEPETPDDTGDRTAVDTGSDEDKAAAAPEWKEASPEAKLVSIQRQRKEVIDNFLADGIFIKIDTTDDTVNAYVGDKFHDLKKREQRFSVQNVYAYYTAENPEIQTVNVYDEQTGKQISEISAKGYKKIKE